MVDDSLSLMTVNDLLAMPDNDGMDRELLAGRLRERPWTPHYPIHAITEAKVASVLCNWLDSQPEPRGKVFSGGVGCILRRNPDSFLGLDVAYMSAEQAESQPAKASFLECAPTLVVEIISPADYIGETNAKIQAFLNANVPLVWVLNPFLRTAMVLGPDTKPVLRNDAQEISGDPHLPGFLSAVSRFFDRNL